MRARSFGSSVGRSMLPVERPLPNEQIGGPTGFEGQHRTSFRRHIAARAASNIVGDPVSSLVGLRGTPLTSPS